MKKILKAFTYIELIVVIIIITLLSSSWIFYFLDFIKWQEIKQQVNVIKEQFSNLEKKVKNFVIFDYEIQLSTNTWTLWYINYINNFDISYKQYIDFNSVTWSGILSITWSGTDNWSIKIYKKNKLYINELIQWDKKINFDFNDEIKYKIIWTLSWETLNEIDINYFSEDNLYPKKNNLLILSEINTKEDKSWSWSSDLLIKNIWWIKSIIWDWINYYDEVYLFFENNWKQDFIQIKK